MKKTIVVILTLVLINSSVLSAPVVDYSAIRVPEAQYSFSTSYINDLHLDTALQAQLPSPGCTDCGTGVKLVKPLSWKWGLVLLGAGLIPIFFDTDKIHPTPSPTPPQEKPPDATVDEPIYIWVMLFLLSWWAIYANRRKIFKQYYVPR